LARIRWHGVTPEMQPQMPAEPTNTIRSAPDDIEIRRTLAAMPDAETHAAKAKCMEPLELAVADTVIDAADNPDMAVVAERFERVGDKAEVRAIDLRMHDHETLKTERALDRAQVVEGGALERHVFSVCARRIFQQIAKDVRLAVAAFLWRQRDRRTHL